MNLHQRYLEFRERFRHYTDEDLVRIFNRETGQNGWVGARGAFLKALYEELKARPLDISVIETTGGLSLSRPVRLESGKLVPDEDHSEGKGGGLIFVQQ
jgi:hypothetical protein